MKTKFKGLIIEGRFVGEKPALFDTDGETQSRHNIMKVTNTANGMTTEFDFYPCVADDGIITNEETLLSALSCFVQDADAGRMDIDEFAEEFGYLSANVKLSNVIETWKACQHAYRSLMDIMGYNKEDVDNLRNELYDMGY